MIERLPSLSSNAKGKNQEGSDMTLRHLVVLVLAPVLGGTAAVQAQQVNSTGPQGSASTPLVLPSNNLNLNPTGAPGARLINDFTLGGPGGLGAPTTGTVPTLNFGPSGIGRLSPPAGSSGVSGIGRIGPPGSIPNLMVTPSLVGPPSLSPGGTITPISNPAASLSGGQGGTGTFNPPSINPTNPNGTNFQANPTGTSGLRNPSNNFRP